MYNQTEAILAQYELEIRQINKGRGNQICDTDKGKRLLIPFRGSKARGDWLRQYLKALSEAGLPVEQIYVNKNGESVTIDETTGESFLLKDQIVGTELSCTRVGEMMEVVELLARFHQISESVSAIGGELKNADCADIIDSRTRHYREIAKVSNYVRSRKKKMDFERLYMANYTGMLQTAERSLEILKRQEQVQFHAGGIVCHGDCNQHNAVWTGHAWQLIHFENASYNWRTADLANFVRKMLEKNEWDEELGMELIKAYTKVSPLSKDEYLQLYGLLLFPEKFWKIANHYMNSNKAWIPARDIEKLEKVIKQEARRIKFTENLFSIAQE